MNVSFENTIELYTTIQNTTQVITGTINDTTLIIYGTIEPDQIFDITGEVEPEPVQETFNESYEVTTSLTDDTVLPTKGKVMTDDIVVKKVPMTEVSNESGGYTIAIG